MGKQTTTGKQASRIIWDNLEEWVRKKVQEFIQSLLEEEVTELLARKKSERRKAVDSSPGYRNGYGKERKLTLGCGTITLHRPRVRGLEERFESRVLPLFVRRSKGVSKLIPQLYLHGLALGDFDLALRGLLGGNAPVSASTVARLKEGWQAEWREWKRRSLEGLQVVYLWVDGVYVKAGLEKEKAALLVVVAGLLDGRKVVLAVEPGYRESTESWSEVLRDLKTRGMNCPCAWSLEMEISASGVLWRTFIPGLPNSAAGTTKWSMCWTSYQRSFRAKPRGICRMLSTQRLVRRPRLSEMTLSAGAGQKAIGVLGRRCFLIR
jgi:putative transposase